MALNLTLSEFPSFFEKHTATAGQCRPLSDSEWRRRATSACPHSRFLCARGKLRGKQVLRRVVGYDARPGEQRAIEDCEAAR